MFCTTLRNRSSYAAILPVLTSPSGLALKGKYLLYPAGRLHRHSCLPESQLDTHDISLPLAELGPPSAAHPVRLHQAPRHLRLLLLSPRSTLAFQLEETINRVLHFASLTGGIDIALVLLLHAAPATTTARAMASSVSAPASGTEGVHAYARLQAALLARPDIPSIPLLPMANLQDLPDLIKSYAQAPKGKLSAVVPWQNVSAIDLLAFCTVNPPLSRWALDLTSDLFSSIADVAEAAALARAGKGSGGAFVHSLEDSILSNELVRDAGGLGDEFTVLRDQLGQGQIERMVEFWAKGSVAD